MNILTKPVKFMTKTIEDLQGDNYLLFQSAPMEFELKNGSENIGFLTIEKTDEGYVGHAEIGADVWTFKPEKGLWPKKFLIKRKGNGYPLKFSLFGFGAKISIEGIDYSFSAGGGGGKLSGGTTNHRWSWKDQKSNRRLLVRSRGSFPDKVSVVAKSELENCSHGFVLIMLARYLQTAYIGGY